MKHAQACQNSLKLGAPRDRLVCTRNDCVLLHLINDVKEGIYGKISVLTHSCHNDRLTKTRQTHHKVVAERGQFGMRVTK